MARIEGLAIARLAWPSALLLACQVGPAPGPARPPPAPTPVTAAPTPAPTPEPTPEPPVPTWAELRAELPEARTYLPTAHAEPPAWLSEVDTLWIRVGTTCRAITLDPDNRGLGALAECDLKSRKADVTCSRSLEVGPHLRVTGSQICSATFPSGAGASSARGGSDARGPIGSLVAADDLRLRYASTWDLWVEAERLVWSETACTPASVAALTAALAGEGLRDIALRDALHQRHGVLGHSRRCLERHGVRLHAQPTALPDRSDRGAEARTEPGLHDCAVPCRDTTATLRRLNAALRGQPFARVADASSVVVHRTRAACDATPGDGLPLFAGDACREWLAETTTARSKPR